MCPGKQQSGVFLTGQQQSGVDLAYNSKVKPALEFLQDKLLDDHLLAHVKVAIAKAYEQFYKAQIVLKTRWCLKKERMMKMLHRLTVSSYTHSRD